MASRCLGAGCGMVLMSLVLGAPLGCGKSEGDHDSPGTGGSAAGASAGPATSEAGASASGSAGRGGNAASGAGGSLASGGEPSAQAGHDGSGGAGLVDCDPRKIFCKRVAPTCEAGQVPSVEGSCYGECVKVDRCACSAAEQCPDPDQYTCWAKQHCGPYVR